MGFELRRSRSPGRAGKRRGRTRSSRASPVCGSRSGTPQPQLEALVAVRPRRTAHYLEVRSEPVTSLRLAPAPVLDVSNACETQAVARSAATADQARAGGVVLHQPRHRLCRRGAKNPREPHNEMHFSRGAVTPGGSASWVTVLSTTAAWLNGPRRRLQMPVRKRGPQNQLCRDALPRPAGPAALPRKTVLDGPAALVATVPYGCGPRTAPRDAPPPFRPASRCVTGSAVNPSSLAVRCRPGQCLERPRPLGPGIDGCVRCARSLKPHPQQQQSGTSRAT